MTRYNFLLTFCLLICLFTQATALPIKPGLAGYGTSTPAGSGRHTSPADARVYKVRSLAAKGPDTLHACVAAAGARVCIFEISGAILLKKPLRIENPYLTIAGQTAPAPGIALFGAGIRVETHDVLVEHLAVRVGDALDGPNPIARDGISIGSDEAEVFNVVLDHLSVSWAIDENVSTWHEDTHDISISNSIFSEALNDSIHPKGPHSKGMMLGDGTKNVSVHYNLLAHNVERNPYVKPGVRAEFVGNVVYNWGGDTARSVVNVSDHGGVKQSVALNLIGNYFAQGRDGAGKKVLYGRDMVAGSRIYVEDNFCPSRLSTSQSEWDVAELDEQYRSLVPVVPFSGIKARPGPESYRHVLRYVGTRPKERNDVDARVLKEVRRRKGRIKDCIEGCTRSVGGFPEYKSKKRKLAVPLLFNRDSNANGYTDLEEWLHAFSTDLETVDPL